MTVGEPRIRQFEQQQHDRAAANARRIPPADGPVAVECRRPWKPNDFISEMPIFPWSAGQFNSNTPAASSVKRRYRAAIQSLVPGGNAMNVRWAQIVPSRWEMTERAQGSDEVMGNAENRKVSVADPLPGLRQTFVHSEACRRKSSQAQVGGTESARRVMDQMTSAIRQGSQITGENASSRTNSQGLNTVRARVSPKPRFSPRRRRVCVDCSGGRHQAREKKSVLSAAARYAAPTTVQAGQSSPRVPCTAARPFRNAFAVAAQRMRPLVSKASCSSRRGGSAVEPWRTPDIPPVLQRRDAPPREWLLFAAVRRRISRWGWSAVSHHLFGSFTRWALGGTSVGGRKAQRKLWYTGCRLKQTVASLRW